MSTQARIPTRPNVFVSAAVGSTQLVYSLRVDPAPLTVSLPDQDPLMGSLVFVITNQQTAPVDVQSIAFTFEAGTNGDDLMTTTSGIQTDASDPVNWQVTPPSSIITDGPAVYSLGPATGSSVTLAPGASVSLQIFEIPVNLAVGTTAIQVKEIAGSQVGFATLELTKFPSGFYFNGLVATIPSGSALVPVAQIGYNTPVTLLWNSSVVDSSSFKVFYATNTGQQQATVSTPGEWPSPNLTRDTVFMVQVTATTVGGQPVTCALTTAVAVQQPDVVANSLAVAGAASVAGNATINGSLSAAAIASSGATINGNLSAATASVSGALSAGSASVTGNLSAGQKMSAGAMQTATLSANTIQNQSGGSPLFRDDNGHTWLFKWAGQQGNNLVAQIFMWDNAQRWGGLNLPVLGYKTFIIDHPVDQDKYLVHATLEGPEAAVFYRGSGKLAAGRAEIQLPEYFEALTCPESWTIQLTGIGGFDRLAVEPVNGQRIFGGRFIVTSDNVESTQLFDWEVKGTRRDQQALEVEPWKEELRVYGFGPYTCGVQIAAADQPQHDRQA